MSSLQPKTQKQSPFTLQKKPVKGKKAFYFLLLIFFLSLSSAGFAVYQTLSSKEIPSAVFSIKKRTVEEASLIDPQPPMEKKAVLFEKEEESFSSLAEALSQNIKSSENKLKQKKTLQETISSAMLPFPEQKEVTDEATLPENENLPIAEVPAKTDAAEGTPQEEQTIDVKNEFAVRKTPLPKPDLIQETLMTSLPNFGAIKNNQNKNSSSLHIIDPLHELQVDSRYGRIPVKTKNGETALQAYGRSYEGKPATPYIAVLVSGLGKRKNTTDAALNGLPSVVSLSFSPYAAQLKSNVADARKIGHETLLDLPMQQGAFPSTDPGPLGLISGLPEQENRKRLHQTLGKNVAYIGVAASPEETFSFTSTQIKGFIQEINDRGLVYVSGSDDPGMPIFPNTLRPDVYILDNFYRAAIRTRLEDAKKIALQKGHAFVRAEPVPIVMLTLQEWMNSFTPSSEEEGALPEITFVPLSFYAKEVLKN